MNHQLTTKQPQSITSGSRNVLPPWYTYLVGSYPNSATSTAQTAAMLDQFRDYAPALLYEAAREFVATDERHTSKGDRVFTMPIAPEFREVVQRLIMRKAQEAQAVQVTAFGHTFNACQVLRAQRVQILDAWYAGAIEAHEVSRFADQMDRAGMPAAAASVRRRISEVTL